MTDTFFAGIPVDGSGARPLDADLYGPEVMASDVENISATGNLNIGNVINYDEHMQRQLSGGILRDSAAHARTTDLSATMPLPATGFRDPAGFNRSGGDETPNAQNSFTQQTSPSGASQTFTTASPNGQTNTFVQNGSNGTPGVNGGNTSSTHSNDSTQSSTTQGGGDTYNTYNTTNNNTTNNETITNNQINQTQNNTVNNGGSPISIDVNEVINNTLININNQLPGGHDHHNILSTVNNIVTNETNIVTSILNEVINNTTNNNGGSGGNNDCHNGNLLAGIEHTVIAITGDVLNTAGPIISTTINQIGHATDGILNVVNNIGGDTTNIADNTVNILGHAGGDIVNTAVYLSENLTGNLDSTLVQDVEAVAANVTGIVSGLANAAIALPETLTTAISVPITSVVAPVVQVADGLSLGAVASMGNNLVSGAGDLIHDNPITAVVTTGNILSGNSLEFLNDPHLGVGVNNLLSGNSIGDILDQNNIGNISAAINSVVTPVVDILSNDSNIISGQIASGSFSGNTVGGLVTAGIGIVADPSVGLTNIVSPGDVTNTVTASVLNNPVVSDLGAGNNVNSDIHDIAQGNVGGVLAGINAGSIEGATTSLASTVVSDAINGSIAGVQNVLNNAVDLPQNAVNAGANVVNTGIGDTEHISAILPVDNNSLNNDVSSIISPVAAVTVPALADVTSGNISGLNNDTHTQTITAPVDNILASNIAETAANVAAPEISSAANAALGSISPALSATHVDIAMPVMTTVPVVVAPVETAVNTIGAATSTVTDLHDVSSIMSSLSHAAAAPVDGGVLFAGAGAVAPAAATPSAHVDVHVDHSLHHGVI